MVVPSPVDRQSRNGRAQRVWTDVAIIDFVDIRACRSEKSGQFQGDSLAEISLRNVSLVAQDAGNSRVRAGDQVRIAFDTAAAHLFDGAWAAPTMPSASMRAQLSVLLASLLAAALSPTPAQAAMLRGRVASGPTPLPALAVTLYATDPDDAAGVRGALGAAATGGDGSFRIPVHAAVGPQRRALPDRRRRPGAARRGAARVRGPGARWSWLRRRAAPARCRGEDGGERADDGRRPPTRWRSSSTAPGSAARRPACRTRRRWCGTSPIRRPATSPGR